MKGKNAVTRIELTKDQIKNLELAEREIQTVSIQHQTLVHFRGKLLTSYAMELDVPNNWTFDDAKRIFIPNKKKPDAPKEGEKPVVPKDGE